MLCLPSCLQVDPLPENIPALQQPAALVAAARRDITPSEQLLQVRCGLRFVRLVPSPRCYMSSRRLLHHTCCCLLIAPAALRSVCPC